MSAHDCSGSGEEASVACLPKYQLSIAQRVDDDDVVVVSIRFGTGT